MEQKEIIEVIKDLRDCPEHSTSKWHVDICASKLIEKLETKQLILHDVSHLLIAWEQYKKANWYESDAIDVDKMIMEQFKAIYCG